MTRTVPAGGDAGGGTVEASAFNFLGDLKPLDRVGNLSPLGQLGG